MGVGLALKAVGNALKKQSIDTSSVDVIEPIEEKDNTLTIAVIALLVLLMGGVAFYFVTKSKQP